MSFFDVTNAIGNPKLNNGHIIHFTHVPTGNITSFKAFITSWDDQFRQDWKEYPTVGRMDSIRIYSRTSRMVLFSFDIPSSNLEEALFNMSSVERLIQMSYPTFDQETIKIKSSTSDADTKNANGTSGGLEYSNTKQITEKEKTTTISRMISPPFFRIKFANWLNNQQIDAHQSSNDVNKSGLYGTIDTVRFVPDFSENAGFYSSNDIGESTNNVLIPKLLKLEILFNVLHTNPLGYDAKTKEVRTKDGSFPYNANNMYNKKYKVK